MDERDDKTRELPGIGEAADATTAWADFPTGVVPATPAPPVDATTGVVPDVAVPSGVAGQRGESPMPLSMPPFGPGVQPGVEAASDHGPAPVAGPVVPGVEAGAGGAGFGGTPPQPPWYGSGAGGYGQLPPPPPAAPHRGGHKLATVAAAAALLAGGLGAGLGVAFGGGSPGSSSSLPSGTKVPVIPSPKSTQASSGPTESTAAIAKAVEPAIVDINTNVASPTSTGQEQAAGTGMIITSSGEVLTNNHVVEQATKITVSIQGHSGTYAAAVIGVDPTKDVALLQIEGFSGTLPTVTLGDSSTVAVGNPVVAIGNALGLGQQPTTVTGIISALGRTITASDGSSTSLNETLSGLIETDAPIQPGDSGGPLINGKGQVIGMDTAASSSSDSSTTLGFAIPINEARSIVQSIEKGQTTDGIVLGESPFLGIYEYPSGTSSPGYGGFGGFGGGGGVSGTSGSSVSGVAVSDVAIGGPAQAAGIVGGDTITKINSTTTSTITALQNAIKTFKVGDQISVTYLDTSGTSHTATVTLAGLPK